MVLDRQSWLSQEHYAPILSKDVLSLTHQPNANLLLIHIPILYAYHLPILLFASSSTTLELACLVQATLTSGGVINRLFVMHDPFPQDYRVLLGQITFEFVEGDPDSEGGITPVPINQLYVHHLSGSVVFGQGTEGVRQT